MNDDMVNVTSPFKRVSQFQLDAESNAAVRHHFDCITSWLQPLIGGVKWIEFMKEPTAADLYQEISKISEIIKPDLFLRVPVTQQTLPFASTDNNIKWNAWLVHSFVWASVCPSISDWVIKKRLENSENPVIADVTKHGFDKQIYEKIINFLYTGKLNFKKSEFEDLKKLSKELEIVHLQTAIQSALENHQKSKAEPFKNGKNKFHNNRKSDKRHKNDKKFQKKNSPGQKNGKNRGNSSPAGSGAKLQDLKVAMELIKMLK